MSHMRAQMIQGASDCVQNRHPDIAALKGAFERDGVVVIRNVITASEIAGLRGAVDQQLAGLGSSSTAYDFEQLSKQVWATKKDLHAGPATRFDLQALAVAVANDPFARPLCDGEGRDTGTFFYDAANWKRQMPVREVALDSALPDLIAQLLDANYVNFWEDTTFVKTPGTGQRTAFHQDLAYFQISDNQCVIVWIALDPVDGSNGAMEYVRGSHLWTDTFAPNVFFAQTPFSKSAEKRCPDIEAHRGDYDIVSFDVMPGDVIVHHVRTVHGAGGNLSHQNRRAVSLRYCGDQVRYLDRPGGVAQIGLTQPLSNGDRLLSSDYPVVWPKPWPGLKLAPLYPVYQ
jgi:ectoine hydroxylase-related dioxygenase (phytanoyl-CoA dioxygenase family)